MGRLSILRADQDDKWQSILDRARQYDFYHLPSYHRLAEEGGEGKASLFVYQDGDRFVALPLLIRQVETVSGLESVGQGLYDATSVYGYAGPLTSEAELPADFLDGFRIALRSAFREARVVAVFSRLHPLIAQQHVLSGLGERPVLGHTVSIDLALPSDVQFSRYRKNHRYEISRLRRMGATCQDDTELRQLDEFVDIYEQTMLRAGAADHYFFDRDYFHEVARMPGAHLFICTLGGETVCGGLFILCNGIVEDHLSGTRPEFYRLAPNKLLIDGVRLWANEQKARVVHLGGGLGSLEDSLLRFKTGFSDRRHDFAVWRWVVDQGAYDRLCHEKESWSRRHGLRCSSDDYFPAYRSPTTTAAEAVGSGRSSGLVNDRQRAESQP